MEVEISSPVGSIKVINRDTDKSISSQLKRGVYEPHVQNALALIAKSFNGLKKPNALDIGANIGIHSILLDKLGFNVETVEASEENNKTLLHNASINDSTLVTHQEYVGNGNTVDFSFNPDNHACSFTCDSSYQQSGEIRTTVQTKKLSDFLTSKFDLIKIDIEGAELNTINGSPEFFERAKYIIIELNKFTCENFFNYSIDNLIDRLFLIKKNCDVISNNNLLNINPSTLKEIFKRQIMLDVLFY